MMPKLSLPDTVGQIEQKAFQSLTATRAARELAL
jgi:hypothetical protein